MAIGKEEIYNLIERLPDNERKTAFDFLKYLVDRSAKKPDSWIEIDKAGTDDEPLTKEEIKQLKSDSGYITGEEAKREFGLQVDLP
jgi:hypothetical protein